MRKPRELKAGALYHVTARANRQEMILDGRGMKELFLITLSRAKKRYRFRIENFCVMGNHFHLMIRPGAGESLSRILQWILSVFAMAYNRIHGLWGHVWGSRFFSRILAGLREFLAVFDYIDRNPMEARRARDPREWRYGGLWEHRYGRRRVADRPASYVEMLVPEHGPVLLERRSRGHSVLLDPNPTLRQPANSAAPVAETTRNGYGFGGAFAFSPGQPGGGLA